jgi:hypothetical protein
VKRLPLWFAASFLEFVGVFSFSFPSLSFLWCFLFGVFSALLVLADIFPSFGFRRALYVAWVCFAWYYFLLELFFFFFKFLGFSARVALWAASEAVLEWQRSMPNGCPVLQWERGRNGPPNSARDYQLVLAHWHRR